MWLKNVVNHFESGRLHRRCCWANHGLKQEQTIHALNSLKRSCSKRKLVHG